MLRNAICKAVNMRARHTALVQTSRLMSDVPFEPLPDYVNKVVLQGRLSNDVRVRTDQKGNQLVQAKVVTEKYGDISMDRRYSEWHNIYIFSNNSAAQQSAMQCSRGDFVLVEGSLSTLRRDQGPGFTLIKTDIFQLLKKSTRQESYGDDTRGESYGDEQRDQSRDYQ